MSILAKTNKDPYTGFKSHYVNDILWHEKLSLINTTCTFSSSVFLGSTLNLLLVHRLHSAGCRKEITQFNWSPPPPPVDPCSTSTTNRVGRPLPLAPGTPGHQRQDLSLQGRKEQSLLISFSKCFLLVCRNIIDFYIYIPVLVTANSFIVSSFFKKIILSVNKDTFIYSFPILCPSPPLFFIFLALLHEQGLQ